MSQRLTFVVPAKRSKYRNYGEHGQPTAFDVARLLRSRDVDQLLYYFRRDWALHCELGLVARLMQVLETNET